MHNNKKCVNCWKLFQISDTELELLEKFSAKINWITQKIPPPTHCPDCRKQRRLSFRNERNLYKRRCDATGKQIISNYSPDKLYKVYWTLERWSDKWNPLEYWRDYNFDKPFFDQFNNLFCEIPQLSLLVYQMENSNFCNNSWQLKDCYLIFWSWTSENCYYWNNYTDCANCVDWLFLNNCQNCYESIDCTNCYKLFYCWWCNNSNSLNYVIDADNSSHCFLSHTVYNKSYYFQNIQYSKNDYFKKVEQFNNLLISEKNKKIKEWENDIIKNKIFPYHLSSWSENISWSGIWNSNNIHFSYDISDWENLYYCDSMANATDCMDISLYWNNSSLMYDSIWVWTNSYKILFSKDCVDWCNNLFYCDKCISCSNCFGCVWLKQKEYCILNKQYTKTEYEQLVKNIIEHMRKTWEWWEFFPIKHSPFWYNESLAQETYFLSEDKAKSNWFKRQQNEYPINIPEWINMIKAENLSENIESIDESILWKAILCETTWKPYRIIKPELDFYKQRNIPIPRKHPNQRHLERLRKRNHKTLFKRNCNNCWVEIKSTYSHERPEIVYCEKCYKKYIYG